MARVVGLGLTAGFACAEAPFAFETTPGKLPKEIVPRHYALRLVPDNKALTHTGSVTIELEVLKPTRRIVLNARELEITKALLLYGENRTLKPIVDAKEQTVAFELPLELKPGKCELALEFRGRINTQPQGLYQDRYQTPSGEKTLLATQMEPVDARRMFPCWDEPVFRATYSLSAVVPAKWLAMSNMPLTRERLLTGNAALKEVWFDRTPAMPSYLVVFAAGEFETLEDEVDGIKLRILCTEGKRESGRYALEVTKNVLRYYNDYFGEKYPLPKLDQLATPGGFGGAMENWGGIIYNEARLLFDPARSPEANRERTHAVIAHEIAHQWFGDLVTMAWWDNLWLNEGFASWMGTKVCDHFNPTWHVWLRAHRDKERVMPQDARKGTHPILQSVRTEQEAGAAFDDITYIKGEQFLRMLEQYLGEDAFRAGMRLYMRRHRLGNTTTADLWAALEEGSGKPVRDFAAGWTERPGLPLVRVGEECKDGKHALTLTQERFTLHDPEAASLTWKVPVRFGQAGDAKANFQVLLEDAPFRLEFGACATAIFANAGDAAYYRTQYSPEMFDALARQIPSLPEADQLNLLGDTWALACAGRGPASNYLLLVEALKGARSLAIWEQVLAVLVEMDALERDRPGRAALRQFIVSVLRPVLAELGWDRKPNEAHEAVLLRAEIIELLGVCGDGATIAEARSRFGKFLENPSSLAPDLRLPVTKVVGRYADAATWEKFHALALKSVTAEDKRIYYEAMQRALDPELARRTMAISLTNEMRPPEKNRNLSRVAETRDDNRLVWEFFLANDAKLLADVDGFRRHQYVPATMRHADDATIAEELVNYMRTKRPDEPIKEAERIAAEIRYRADLKLRAVPDIDAWITARQSAPPPR